VRGGTYFSLPPQRKVGKRKRLTPPARVPIHGPPTSPSFTRQCPGWYPLPTLRTNASPTSNTRTWATGSEWYVPPRWQTVCRLSCRIAWRSHRWDACAIGPEWGVWGTAAYTQFATWAAADYLARRAVMRVHEVGEAYRENVGNEREP